MRRPNALQSARRDDRLQTHCHNFKQLWSFVLGSVSADVWRKHMMSRISHPYQSSCGSKRPSEKLWRACLPSLNKTFELSGVWGLEVRVQIQFEQRVLQSCPWAAQDTAKLNCCKNWEWVPVPLKLRRRLIMQFLNSKSVSTVNFKSHNWLNAHLVMISESRFGTNNPQIGQIREYVGENPALYPTPCHNPRPAKL